ncbi:MAG TPA: radical SAM protein [Verrucomicrobiae bacterium]|nr:radical SAM protein [Verrucomicrobiae bacterium]
MNPLNYIQRLVTYGFPARRPPAPLLLIFHITTRCNMACRHCADDVWGDPANDLTLEEIDRFSRGIGRVESIALGGGEPFLRRDLPDICRLFATNARAEAISIPTNGFAVELVCSAVRSIFRECPGLSLNIMLSLDGLQETHDAIRTPGSFEKVLETARRLQEMQGEFPSLQVTFNATIHSANAAELPDLSRFLRETFGTRMEFNIIAGNPRDCSLKVPAAAELERSIEGIREGAERSFFRRMYDRVYRDVLLRTNSAHRQAIPCRAGSLICLVDANGDVRVCPTFPPLGNVKSVSFRSIWSSEAARIQFESVIRGGCACNNDCFTRLSLSHYWKLPFMMLKNGLLPGRGRQRK